MPLAGLTFHMNIVQRPLGALVHAFSQKASVLRGALEKPIDVGCRQTFCRHTLASTGQHGPFRKVLWPQVPSSLKSRSGIFPSRSYGRLSVSAVGAVPLQHTDKDSTNGAAGRVAIDGAPALFANGNGAVSSAIEEEAWALLRRSVVTYCNMPVGTVASFDPLDASPLNYDQVFIRDFVPSAIAFLLKGEYDIVRNFLVHTLQLQSWEKSVDYYSPGQGLMPASFKVRVSPLQGGPPGACEEILDPDFGESAIGRVAPVDSGLWWIILLRAFGIISGDKSLEQRVDMQTGVAMILRLCLSDGFDMFPTLLVADGPCMIDRRMGLHGHPLEIQALFYHALRCGRDILDPEQTGPELLRSVNARLLALPFHIREYYWVDRRTLNRVYRYQTEEYSPDALNKFNIYPEQIPGWLIDWIPDRGGYLAGNLQPAHMDFRFFALGNLWSIVSALATPEQGADILRLIEARWDDLVGAMPFKICFPAMEGEEWRIVTGSDPKNTPWSYHNGGAWPVLLWQFTAACIKMGRPDLAQRAVRVAEQRLSQDQWPEYYDSRSGRFIGKRAKLYQTWSIAGYLAAKMLLQNPHHIHALSSEEDVALPDSLTQNPSMRRRKGPRPAPPTY